MTNKPRLLITGGSGDLGDWGVRLVRETWDVTATYFTHPPETLDTQSIPHFAQASITSLSLRAPEGRSCNIM